jgi:PAS domain S-box-containing protein
MAGTLFSPSDTAAGVYTEAHPVSESHEADQPDNAHHPQPTPEALLIEATAAAGDAILALARDGTIMSANPGAARMFACHERLLVGAHIGAFLQGLKSDDDTGPSIDLLINRLGHSDGHAVDTVGFRLNGGGFAVEITARSFLTEGRTYLACVIRDVTDRKKSEVDLLQAKETAERANRAKSQFLSELSHELRTPLSTIIGFAEVMKNEMFGPLGVKLYLTYARDILNSGQQMLDVVERILEVTRLERGTATAAAQIVDIGLVTDKVLSGFSQAARDANLRLTSHIRRGAALAYLDIDALEKMLRHLVGNAVKYNRPGGAVEVAVAAAAEDAKNITIKVNDSGVGMDSAQLDHIRRKIEGDDEMLMMAGGGLALCASYLRLIGGRLSIESRAGMGTTVELLLPQHAETARY